MLLTGLLFSLLRNMIYEAISVEIAIKMLERLLQVSAWLRYEYSILITIVLSLSAQPCKLQAGRICRLLGTSLLLDCPPNMLCTLHWVLSLSCAVHFRIWCLNTPPDATATVMCLYVWCSCGVRLPWIKSLKLCFWYIDFLLDFRLLSANSPLLSSDLTYIFPF